MKAEDPLWGEFQALWSSLPVSTHLVLLAGGYGLFLKQRWLLSEPGTQTLVGIQDWRDAAPRVTGDMDFVLGLDLISSQAAQEGVARVLSQQGFEVASERGARWQFSKQIGVDRTIKVELHAPIPVPGAVGLELDKLRVKHKPSLGKKGVHGRQNHEAAGCELHPFAFRFEGINVLVPNPVTWAVMKLVAMQDRWERSQDGARDESNRAMESRQATKHGRDVARIVAMMTREENDRLPDVFVGITKTEGFAHAAEAFGGLLSQTSPWGRRFVATQWNEEDWLRIQGTLAQWFG